VPPDCALDTKFDMSMFKGRWYITAGYNPLFDIFDCQVGGLTRECCLCLAPLGVGRVVCICMWGV
jgi:hypothetical protein